MTRKLDADLTAKLKAKVALAALRGDESVQELARQFNLDPALIDEWKKQLEQNAESAFFRSDNPLSEAPTLPNPAPSAKSPTLPTLPTVRERPTLPGSTVGPKAPTLQTGNRDVPKEKTPTVTTLDDDFWEDETQAPTLRDLRVSAAAVAPSAPGAEHPAAWTRRLLGPLFMGWQEKHHAARTSRELLKLYRTVAAARPGLNKLELYREVVLARLGGTRLAADALLSRAAESFAAWPVERELTFRDVVHYLAVSDYLRSNNDIAEWTRENMGRVVASHVPEDL